MIKPAYPDPLMEEDKDYYPVEYKEETLRGMSKRIINKHIKYWQRELVLLQPGKQRTEAFIKMTKLMEWKEGMK